MKWLIIILLVIPSQIYGQGLQIPKVEKLEIIPIVSSSYMMTKIELDYTRKVVIPEVFLGIAIKDDKWFSCVKYGFIWNTVELQIGFVIRVKK